MDECIQNGTNPLSNVAQANQQPIERDLDFDKQKNISWAIKTCGKSCPDEGWIRTNGLYYLSLGEEGMN